ncbi:hypothetical protein FB561_1685 [Kribbella amoyensis]|uniref:DUF4352 domain-containing protein n=1 Tax=Kribbella amoyensis TaxID=996641 RepID=A0A561BP88_9ACTN|nr:hypothetical protein [Kribbella amoyensis]TWD80602.1 hypothetical protein FB561_1685 [Kribbella amoyensis]
MKVYRPATVAIGVVLVLLGGIVRLGDPDAVFEDPSRIVTHGAIGEDVAYGDSQVTVTRVAFTKSFIPRDSSDAKVVQTKGVFVAVEYDVVRGADDPGSTNVSLKTEAGSVYRPVTEGIDSGIPFPAAGFAQTGGFVFEVNPSDLAGLTFYVEPVLFFNTLAYDLSIDLGVPSEDIAQRSIERAGEEYLLIKPEIRVAS